jgi:hypothetical protein
MDTIDWTAIGSISSSIGVIVAIIIFIFQSRRAMLTKAIDILMQYDKRFDSTEFRLIRSRAAKYLLSGNKKEDGDGRQAISDVLNFFEAVAFLYKNKIIKADMIWHTFASWFLAYWKAAELYIQESRLEDPTAYEDTNTLFDAVLTIEKKARFNRTKKSIDDEYVKHVLECETELYIKRS